MAGLKVSRVYFSQLSIITKPELSLFIYSQSFWLLQQSLDE